MSGGNAVESSSEPTTVWVWDVAAQGLPPRDLVITECFKKNRPAIFRHGHDKHAVSHAVTYLRTAMTKHLSDTIVPVVEMNAAFTPPLGWTPPSSLTDDAGGQAASSPRYQIVSPQRKRGGEGGEEEPNETVPTGDQCLDVPWETYLSKYDGAEVWRQLGREGDVLGGDTGLRTDEPHRVGYLKDWHFCAAAGQRLGKSAAGIADDFYGGHPRILGGVSDWLNELRDEAASVQALRDQQSPTGTAAKRDELGGGSGGDYRFVYVGSRNCWTPLHVDVYGSYSWSLNLAGCKEWFFARLEDFDELWARYLQAPGTLASRLPLDMRCSTLRYESVLQHPGDIVFVPSMYLHQVHNVTHAVSVNHNWACEFNAAMMVKALVAEAKTFESMVDAETVRMMKADYEWTTTLDRALMGSGGWSVRALMSYLEAAEDRHEHDNPGCVAVIHQCLESLRALAR